MAEIESRAIASIHVENGEIGEAVGGGYRYNGSVIVQFESADGAADGPIAAFQIGMPVADGTLAKDLNSGLIACAVRMARRIAAHDDDEIQSKRVEALLEAD